MKKQIFSMLCMIMLFTGSAMAQQFSGESDSFEFNTLEAQGAQAVPIAPFAVVLTVLLAASFMIYRFWKQKRKQRPDVMT